MKIYKLTYLESSDGTPQTDVFFKLEDAITEGVSVLTDWFGDEVSRIAEDLYMEMDVAREWNEQDHWQFWRRFYALVIDAKEIKRQWDGQYISIAQDTVKIPVNLYCFYIDAEYTGTVQIIAPTYADAHTWLVDLLDELEMKNGKGERIMDYDEWELLYVTPIGGDIQVTNGDPIPFGECRVLDYSFKWNGL